MAQRENPKLELRVAEEPATDTIADGEGARFPELLLILAKRKSFVWKFVGLFAVLSVTVSLLLPKVYTATTRIMPPQQTQSLSTTAMLSQLGPLAALATQGLGLRSPSDVYVAMLRSDTIANDLIDRFSLMSVYHSKLREDARRTLANRTLIVSGKEGIITISVEDRDPHRAAEMANSFVEELEKLTRTLAVTEAGQRRIFFERETNMASDDLAAAEVALKQTQEKTGLILLDPQSRAMIDEVASLRAHIASQEVEVQSMSSYATQENPDLLRAKQELTALRDQLSKLERGQGGRSNLLDVPIENVPTAGLEYIRKLREVRYREALFELLAKQYEAAKIDEARDTFLVQQLDRASVPERKSWPIRSLIVIVSTSLALLVAITVVFSLEKLERAKEDPHFASRLQLFKFYLGRLKKE